MLTNVTWSEDLTYKSDSNAEPLEFFSTAFEHSTSLDLLLGYFSFSAIRTLSFGLAIFLAKGGKMRIVANHILSRIDKEILVSSQSAGLENSLIDLTDITATKSMLDDCGQHFFNCIAHLIRENRLEIVLIEPEKKKGIAHYKQGIFSDGRNEVYFSGSCNFTAYGLMENLENLDITLGWEGIRSQKKIKNQKHLFESYFNQTNENVAYVDAVNAQLAIDREFQVKNIDDLLEDELSLKDKYRGITPNRRIRRLFDIQEQRIKKIRETPKFPYPKGPRGYQSEAHERWVQNGKKGIFAMATGTGKTLTSLNCLLEEYNESGSYQAVVLVPTIALAEQWKEECAKFNFRKTILVNTKNNWEQELSFFNTTQKIKPSSCVIIVTYASFSNSKFQNHFNQLPANTLLIADEAHNMGAGKTLALLHSIHLKKRIGLSATIERQYDEQGNRAIETFFNDTSPYVMELPMSEAMQNGWLCDYDYYPHVVRLTAVELDRYKEISQALIPFFDHKTGKYKDSEFVKMKLLERKRILHKAANKLPKFRTIMENEFKQRGSLKFTLVYAPEGGEADYEQIDNSTATELDKRLLHDYTKAVSTIDRSILIREFTSATKNREEVLKQFRCGDTHVLTSMKCLDEGVDVPRSELAIFCASTGNPRQFIQRRGRVLRTHKLKAKATIHDLVVVPQQEGEINPDTFSMERTIFRKELERVVDFARLALNKSDSYLSLQAALDWYDLNLNDIKNTQ